MIKKQKKLIIILGAAAVALIILYFTVLAPMLAVTDDTTEEIPNLLSGEVLGTSNRILMFEHVETADIQSVEVHNDSGVYTMERGDDDNFYIKGNEGAPYSKTMLSSLMVSSGYTLSMTRVAEQCSDMSVYGLAEDDNPAWYVLTKTDGTQHTVYIGDLIPTGAGYYCRYAGRDAVYVLDSSLATTLLADIRTFITPILSYPVSSTTYYQTDDFYIARDGELFVWIDYLTEEEQTQLAMTDYGTYVMKFPGSYTPSTTNYDAILQKFADFEGTSVVEIGKTSEVMPAETLAKYGIDMEKPAYELHYTYSGVENFVYFSAQQEDGSYYAYSLLFNLVAVVPADTAEFLQWDLIKFVDAPIFQKNINDIAKIEIISDTLSETFKLEGEGQTIEITPASTGKVLDTDQLYNFRQFYKVMLTLSMVGYTESTATDDLYATMIVTTDAGVVTTYRFYPYSTRRAFYTVNGEGEFYMQRDMMEKLISDLGKVLSGEAVDSEVRY